MHVLGCLPATSLDNGIRGELTVGPQSAVHRYTFPACPDARVVIDFSQGGLSIEYGRTVPLRVMVTTLSPDSAAGEVVMAGGFRLEFDSIRETTLRPFGLMFRGLSASRRHRRHGPGAGGGEATRSSQRG